MNDDVVAISLSHYNKLLADSRELAELYNQGVQLWEGYVEALLVLDEEEESNE